ncbi:hypothetical protein HHK36_027565 [Tetracentron sinense]|uniref:Zinc-ribbon domain-containing protein n=1 Tax=Tetracentron sinense TaxID=13715 RepID=A0A835D1P4_TETSI|nr:hypothetical protein HHK36_027565 [Tetracentron sinense]
MAEGAKVRVVRCPKCDNLLPELPDYPLYQCGGCGAVLRAKNKTPANEGSSEKSDEEKARGGSEKLETFSEKGGVNLSDASETDKESNGVECGRRRERVLPEIGANLNCSSSSPGTENREVLTDYNGVREVETISSLCDQRIVEKEVGHSGKYRPSSKAPVDNWVLGNDHKIDKNKAELAKANMEKEFEDITPQIGNASGSRKSGKIPDWQSAERDGMAACRRNSRAVVEGVRIPNSLYPDEGPSNYHPGSSYGNGNGKPIMNQSNLDGPNRVGYLEQDRAELLRKLDELKDQLSRSCDVADRSKERVPINQVMVPPDPYSGRNTWLPDGSSNRASMQSFAQDNHVPRPPYFNHSQEPVPIMNMHDRDMQNIYPPIHTPNQIPGYGDPFGSQMLKRASHQPPHQYPQRPSHEYFSGHYMDVNPDPLASYPQNTFFHQPACSCLHCYNKHWQVPTQVPPSTFRNRGFLDAPINPMYYHLENPATYGPQVYNPRGTNPPPLHSHEQQRHTRRPSNLDSEIGGLYQCRSRKVLLANRYGRRCQPTAGGAPFITCYNCFELLKLPRKVLLMEKNQQKLRCGACSTVISFAVENKRLVISVPAQTTEARLEVDDGSGEAVTEGLLHSHGYAKRGSMNSSDDYDNSGYNFQSIDTEPILLSKDQRLNLCESQNMRGFLSSYSSTSEDEESPDSVIAQREVSKSAELPLRANGTPPLPGSPIHEHFDYSSSNHAVLRSGKGNRSKRSDQEKGIPNNGTSRQNSVKDESVATEMDVSFNEYSNTCFSQDSEEVSKEEHRQRISKGGESFFAGLIKKSFRDLSRSNQKVENDGINVSINGQSIPDHLVKKAEKQAGPIHPGQYWYDFRAGFWGVMGKPCLGIIPPSIEEFNYPMPKNCAAGNTGVLVNGRELHQRDLNLLGSRGLPTTRDKSYSIEISGRVWDDDSGEELDSLGKLAPTVERVKHGFGMRVPRVTA